MNYSASTETIGFIVFFYEADMSALHVNDVPDDPVTAPILFRELLKACVDHRVDAIISGDLHGRLRARF